MKKIHLFALLICINVIFAILLIYKQNQIISLRYQIQKLQDHKEQLVQQKKDLYYQLHKEQQLSHVKSFATDTLRMKPISIKEAKALSLRNGL